MLKFLSEGQLLTEALKAAEEGAASLSDLEELCAPFHPSRRIRPKYLPVHMLHRSGDCCNVAQHVTLDGLHGALGDVAAA